MNWYIKISKSKKNFTSSEAKKIGEDIGIDWKTSPFDLEQFRIGLGVEMEHGSQDPDTNVINNDHDKAGKIAWAHLKEMSDYYTKLVKMEQEAGEKE